MLATMASADIGEGIPADHPRMVACCRSRSTRRRASSSPTSR